MFIWGHAGDVVYIDQGETRYCSVCEKDRSFSVVLQYEYQHAYYIFGFVNKRQYILACDVCQRGQILDTAEVERGLERIPIPFMRRFGCLIFVVAFVAFIALCFLAGEVGNAGKRR